VQIWVLRRRLQDVPGVRCQVLDIGASRRQRRAECLPTPTAGHFVAQLLGHAARQYVIHLHTNGHNLKSWLMATICAAAGGLNGRRTVVSLGSGALPDYVRRAGRSTRALIRASLASTGAIVCRNEHAREALIDLGIAPGRILVAPGFYGVQAGDTAPIPSEIEAFLGRHSPVLAAMGSSGHEYGLPLVVAAATRLR